MGRISSGIGLVSGINSREIIDQLISLESRPKVQLQKRIDNTNQIKLAYTDLSTRLTSLRLSAISLRKATTFQQASASSNNEGVLTATASAGAAKGSYQFQVSRLVTSQQSISSGLASTSSKVGAGTLTIEMGGGEVYSQTLLSDLNGGQGIRRGSFRITDQSGKSAVIDVSAALSLDDVVRKINTSLDISVKAEVKEDKLVLTDLTGLANNNLTVADMGGGFAAADLGIAGNGAGTLTGTNINSLGRSTQLATLNDGRGVRHVSGQADFQITAANGSTFDVDLGTATNLGEVLDAINTATGGLVTASLTPGERFIRLSDTSGGGGNVQVTALNGSLAARDLGLEQTGNSTELLGNTVLASLNSVLLSSLRGGAGLTLGTIALTDRAGNYKEINLQGTQTVQEMLDRINANGTAQVTARLKTSGNGIEIVDNSGGTGNLIISDVGSTTAAELGITGTFAMATPVVKGANLQRQWISENTLLSTYNAGRGVTAGKFKITNSLGSSATISLTSNDTTLQNVIDRINAASIGVTASINANGDGLLLTDTAGGGLTMSVTDTEGTAAASLNIAGSATGTTLDGSFEKTITLDATKTLQNAVDDINLPGFGVSAAIVNDGTGATPYRLSLTARNTGRAGRVVFDAGTTSLQTTNLVEAQDAVVFFGGTDASNSLLVTSGSNKISGVIKGVTLDLHGTSAAPVTVNVTDNVDKAVGDLKSFVENFNAMVEKVQDLTKFEPETKVRGLLLGQVTVQKIETELYGMIHTVVKDAGQYKMLVDLGVKTAEGAKLEFDEEKFRAAYAADPQAVKAFFTLFQEADASNPAKKGMASVMEDRINRLIDPVNGLITRENKQLDKKVDQFNDRIEQLDKLIEAKRLRLERQFASLESVLANLQSQQQAIAGFSGVPPMTSSKS